MTETKPCTHNGGAAYTYDLEHWGDLFPGAWETPELALAAGKRTVQQNSLPGAMGKITRYAVTVRASGAVELEPERTWGGIDFLTQDPAELEP